MTTGNLKLDLLIEEARNYHMTPEERREQIISFAYGNLKLHNPAVTREEIEKALNDLEVPTLLSP